MRIAYSSLDSFKFIIHCSASFNLKNILAIKKQLSILISFFSPSHFIFTNESKGKSRIGGFYSFNVFFVWRLFLQPNCLQYYPVLNLSFNILFTTSTLSSLNLSTPSYSKYQLLLTLICFKNFFKYTNIRYIRIKIDDHNENSINSTRN